MESQVYSGDYNRGYLFINGLALPETEHWTYSASDWMYSTGGRVVTLEVSAGDEIEIRITEMDGSYAYILYCAEFIPKM